VATWALRDGSPAGAQHAMRSLRSSDSSAIWWTTSSFAPIVSSEPRRMLATGIDVQTDNRAVTTKPVAPNALLNPDGVRMECIRLARLVVTAMWCQVDSAGGEYARARCQRRAANGSGQVSASRCEWQRPRDFGCALFQHTRFFGRTWK
jgi:hypothetical protein